MPDDSAVYRMGPAEAIISTMDFFPPVVDDAYDFGAIAAANALSDVYAMGGEPLFAINLVAYPDGLGLSILSEIMRGGAEKVREAGAVIAGGHTVTDKEPKYGLAVTGRVHPDKIITKGGAQPGDKLILTKPLGTGVITTALKNGQVDHAHLDAAIISMSRLNRDAARAAVTHGVHAMTDVTGYSLVGHAYEMASAGSVTLHFEYDVLPMLPGATYYANRGIAPGGTQRNMDYFKPRTSISPDMDDTAHLVLFDPQTSGGLLMAVSPDRANDFVAALRVGGDGEASIVGTVLQGPSEIMIS